MASNSVESSLYNEEFPELMTESENATDISYQEGEFHCIVGDVTSNIVMHTVCVAGNMECE